MSKTVKKTTEELPKYVRRLTGGTYEARKMINGRTIRVSGKNLTEVMLEFEFFCHRIYFFNCKVRHINMKIVTVF